jgi:hypothetical protein
MASSLVAIGDAGAVVVICKKGKKLLLREASCKGKEQQVAASELGVVGPQGPQGVQGPKGDMGDAGPGARWALVNASGNIVAQSGGITVAAVPQAGEYILNFGTSVAGKTIIVSAACLEGSCPFVGTPLAGRCGGGPEGDVCAPPNNDPSKVFVLISAPTNDALQSSEFYVAVF